MPSNQGAAAAELPWDWEVVRSRCLREARRVLRDPEDAEEAVQEALARAWRRRDACATPHAPLGWMLQITRNEALRLVERRTLRRRREVLTETEPERASYEAVDALITTVCTNQVLKTLPPEDRILIHLRYRRDLSQAEVARRLNLPEGTVKVRLHRIRKRLQDAWQEDR
jgi:RNA polymerase sigma-70 factor (ECF subfamily)